MVLTREKLQQIFKVYDEKRNGQIRTIDLTKLVRSALLFPSEADIVQLEKNIDPTKQGFFTMSKFVDLIEDFAEKQSHINHEEQLLKAFSFFDEQESGFITEADLKKIMNAFGQPLSQEQTREILKYSKAVNGRINYRNFVNTIVTGKTD